MGTTYFNAFVTVYDQWPTVVKQIEIMSLYLLSPFYLKPVRPILFGKPRRLTRSLYVSIDQFHDFCRLLIFFQSKFQNFLPGIPSECQTVWI